MEKQVVRVEISSPQKLIETLRRQRRKQKIAQAKVALYANISTTSLGEIERGEVDPRFSNLLKLLNLCGIKLILEYKDSTQ